MLSKWFGKRVAEPMTRNAIPDFAHLGEKLIRQTSESTESAGKTFSDGDTKGSGELGQTRLGEASTTPETHEIVARQEAPPSSHPNGNDDLLDRGAARRGEEGTPLGEQNGASPFAWHPDAAVLDRAVTEFPSVFDKPRTLAELRQELSQDMRFDDLMAVRGFSHQQYGLKVPDLSVENLNGLNQNVWDNANRINFQSDVYRAFRTATEPNAIPDPQAYMRQLADIVAARAPEVQWASIQGVGNRGGARMLYPDNSDRVVPEFVHFFQFERANPNPDVGYRVYVNAQANVIPDLTRGLVHEIVDRPDNFPDIHSAKVVGAHSVRSDAMVIYTTDLVGAHRVVDWLREYQTREPHAFLWNTPPMTKQVLEGVGIGAEPVMPNSSFGSVRAQAIYDALRSTSYEGGDFAMFHERVLARLADLGVDPEHPHFNRAN
ncbi:T3SS effector HopA1 family protein [Nocardia sp. NPDC050630]|uniref:T3SS effector HopA1 family protein n=1 Tax=Nocardia sp. NPDC050630 TaxID=3364321 RepID=UPI003796E1F1